MTTQTANHRLKRDLRLIARDAEDLLKATAGQAGHKATEIRHRLNGALESARTTYRRYQDKTVATARETARATDRVIRRHPYESLGIALGTGLLVGVLVARRR